MAKKKKEEKAVVEQVETQQQEEQKEVTTVEDGLFNDLMNKTEISGIMMSLIKTVIPNLTAGGITIKDSYYDKKKHATVVEIEIRGESDYEVTAEIKIDGNWVVDLKIKNMTTGLVYSFNYSEDKGEDDDDE